MKVEDILSYIHGTGRYHQILMTLSTVTVVSFQFSIHFYAFALFEPKGIVCQRATQLVQNKTTKVYSPSTELSVLGNTTELCTWSDENASNATWKCTKWRYPQAYITSNLVTQENLICDRSYLRPTLECIYLIGVVLGHVTIILTTRFPRRMVFLSLLTLQCLGILTFVFVENLWFLGVLMFVQCYTRCINYIALTQIVEILPIDRRATFSNMFYLSVGVGITLFSVIAYWMRSFHLIKLFVPVFCVILPPLLWLFPKSPRQLILKGQHKSALECLNYIAYFNNANKDLAKISQKLEVDIPKLNEQKEPDSSSHKESFSTALKDPSLRRCILLCTAYVGFVELCKFSLIWNMTYQTEDIYLNLFISGVSDIVAIVPPLYLADKCTRRKLCLSFALVCSLSTVATPLLDSCFWLKMVVGTVSKMLIRGLSNLMDLVSVEFFPTTIRDECFNLGLIYRSLLIVGAPLLRHVLSDDLAIQVYAGCVLVIAVVAFCYLPETKGLPLPQTIEEFHKNQSNLSEQKPKSDNVTEIGL